jgi:hypothetical protein
LKFAAGSFIKLQLARHAAGYDNSKVWPPARVYETVGQARAAMTAWMKIRENEIVQDYLFDLMGTR